MTHEGEHIGYYQPPYQPQENPDDQIEVTDPSGKFNLTNLKGSALNKSLGLFLSVTSKGDTGLSSYNYLGGQLHNEGVLQAEERHFATAGQVDNLDYFEPQEIQVQQIEATQQPGTERILWILVYM